MTLREELAIAIYSAAFSPRNDEEAQRIAPSPGWCWVRTSEGMREFARRQADAALGVMATKGKEQEQAHG